MSVTVMSLSIRLIPMARLVTITDLILIKILVSINGPMSNQRPMLVDPCIFNIPKVPVKVRAAGTEHCPVSWEPPPFRHQHRVREPPLPPHHVHQGEGLVRVGRLDCFAVWPGKRGFQNSYSTQSSSTLPEPQTRFRPQPWPVISEKYSFFIFPKIITI